MKDLMISKKYFYIILFVIALIISISGCSDVNSLNNEGVNGTAYASPSSQGDSFNSEHNTKGEIKIGLCNIDVLNPLTTQNTNLRRCMTLVYDSLVILGRESKPECKLAESFSTNDGGFSWNIILKKDVLFHDGSNFTAYDVKNTIEWIKSNKCFYSDALLNVSSMEISKNNEIKIILSQSDSLFPSKLTFPIIKSEDLSGDFKILNGTGLYKHNGGMIFENFSDYYGNPAKINKIELVSFEEVNELYSSEADIMFFEGDDVIRYKAKKGYSKGLYESDILSCLVPSDKLDINIKKFFDSLIDRNLILKAVYSEAALEKNVPIIEKTYFLDKYTAEENIEITNVVLPETIRFIIKKSDYDLQRISEIIEKEIPANVNVDKKVCSDEEFNDLFSKGEYDFAYMNVSLSPYPDFYKYFHTNGAENINKFSNDSVDNLIISINKAFENSEISLVMDNDSFYEYASTQTNKLAVVLEENLPIIPICQTKNSLFVKDTLSGMSMYNLNFWNLFESFNDLKIS